MPSAIGRCADHGFFEGQDCPVCDGGQSVLGGDRRKRLSKFCSGALRHFPDDVGLELDDAGWTLFADLVTAAESKYDWADREAVAGVVATDPKGRFERTGSTAGDGTDRVRAAYGHSVPVNLDGGEEPVPDTLYHGTAPRHLDSIRDDGLQPMSRQHVHLSGSVESAREVGSRHAGNPVILEVDTVALQAAGHDVTQRGRDVYTTDRVPPAYLEETG